MAFRETRLVNGSEQVSGERRAAAAAYTRLVEGISGSIVRHPIKVQCVCVCVCVYLWRSLALFRSHPKTQPVPHLKGNPTRQRTRAHINQQYNSTNTFLCNLACFYYYYHYYNYRLLSLWMCVWLFVLVLQSASRRMAEPRRDLQSLHVGFHLTRQTFVVVVFSSTSSPFYELVACVVVLSALLVCTR